MFRKTIAALITALCLLAPLSGPAHAQEGDAAFDSVVVQVWPEYDQTSALVLITGRASAVAPGMVRYALPATASLHAAAWLADDGRLLQAEHAFEDGVLTLASPNGSFHIEYYDTSLSFTGVQRRFTYLWNGQFAVNDLVIEVQQPARTETFTLSPPGESLDISPEGLNTHIIRPGAFSRGETFEVKLNYTRTVSTLTVELLGADESGTRQAVVLPTAWVIGVGAVVLLAAVAGGAYWMGNRRGAAQSASSAARSITPPAEVKLPAQEMPLPPDAPTGGQVILSEREVEVIKLLAAGLVNRDIGLKLGISPKTVARHRENIMAKLGLHTRTDLVKYAIRVGLASAEAIVTTPEAD